MKVEQFRIPFTVNEMEIMLNYIQNDGINNTDPTYKNLFKKLKTQHFKCSEGLKKADYVNLNKPKVSNHPTADDMGLTDDVTAFLEKENDRLMAEFMAISAANGNPTEDKRKENIVPDTYKRRDDPKDNDSEAAGILFNDLSNDEISSIGKF